VQPEPSRPPQECLDSPTPSWHERGSHADGHDGLRHGRPSRLSRSLLPRIHPSRRQPRVSTLFPAKTVRARFLAGLTALLLVGHEEWSGGHHALAQAKDQGPTAQEIVPPKWVEGIPPEYPAGATGSSRVIVEVVLGPDGLVEKATAVDGGPPFAKLAEDAVLRYRFSPAKRGAVAVRARVRLVVSFDPPEPPPPPPTTQPASVAAGSSPPPPTEEVSVTGRRYETSSPTEHRMGRAEVRLLPGAFGDPFRAIEVMPGVVPTISGFPYYYVRGAPPAAVGYFVDEVRVPYLFHFGLGPSVIEPALIKEVTLHPAAYPARYGRFAGGIVAGETTDPSPTAKGEALIRLYDAGAFVEAPFANGKGHVALGGRYSYTALALSLVVPDLNLSYRDYNARFSYRISDRVTLTAFVFGSFDYASEKKEDEPERVYFASEFNRLDVRLDHEGEKSHSRIATTFGLDRTRLEGERFARDYLLGVRARHRVSLNEWAEVEAGADVSIDVYQGDLPSPYAVYPETYERAAALYSPRTDSSSGAWVTALLRPTKKTDVTLTARADLFSSDGALAIGPSPRASVRAPLSERFAFLSALGIAPQAPGFALPIPAVTYRGLPGGLSYAYQKSAGIEAKLPLDFVATAVGFHHSYFNLTDVFADGITFDFDGERVTSGAVQAFGLEVLVRRKMAKRVSATFSYTLSRNVVGSTQERKTTLNRLDRTHVFQAALAFDLTHGWFTSLRSVIYSGWPDETAADNGYPSRRLNPFFRFDARIEKRWRLGSAGHISLVLEGLNVTASKEPLRRSCTERGCKDTTIGPIVAPSIGVEGAL
jgi:hypothetical protein